MSAEHGERRRRLLYGRRKGPKLSAHQQSLFQTLLPQLEIKLEAARDPQSYFDSCVEDIWLEIGFGAGEHLLWQAACHLHVGLIGAEPYEAGVARLLSKIGSLSSLGGRTIRIYQGDARDLIEAFPDASFGRVFLLFPDPWPKKRHHKRRFIQMETLDALARTMKPGAEFRFASDNPGYIDWTLERLIAHPAFVWKADSANDWKTRPAGWPPTRYEEKALHGLPVFLRFVRQGLQRGGAERT